MRHEECDLHVHVDDPGGVEDAQRQEDAQGEDEEHHQDRARACGIGKRDTNRNRLRELQGWAQGCVKMR